MSLLKPQIKSKNHYFFLSFTNQQEIWKAEMISALGLDVGKKRIGVAGCDGTGLIATGLTTIERRSFLQDVAQFRAIVELRQVQVLVVGLPYNMDGSIGFQAKQVQKFAQRLSAALQLPVEYVDERLTSFQAEQLLIAENRAPSRHKGLIDRKAAAIILQQWLDDRRSAARPNLPSQSNQSQPILSAALVPKAVEWATALLKCKSESVDRAMP